MYIDNTQPYPDAYTAAVLAGPAGPCFYSLKDGIRCVTPSSLVDDIASTIKQVMGELIARTLAHPLYWMLAVEMEAVTHCIANLAMVEAQSENLVSSYMVVLQRLAENKLKFKVMAVEAPRATDANESSPRRVVRTLDQFSDDGET